MAFTIPEKPAVCPDDPKSLFRDLRKKTVPGLLSFFSISPFPTWHVIQNFYGLSMRPEFKRMQHHKFPLEMVSKDGRVTERQTGILMEVRRQ